MKVLYVALGVLGFAFRYLQILWDRNDPNGVDQRANLWGWDSAHMIAEFSRVGEDDRHNFLHLCKNCLVEYFEQEPYDMSLRRGVGFLSLVAVLGMICAFILGALVF